MTITTAASAFIGHAVRYGPAAWRLFKQSGMDVKLKKKMMTMSNGPRFASQLPNKDVFFAEVAKCRQISEILGRRSFPSEDQVMTFEVSAIIDECVRVYDTVIAMEREFRGLVESHLHALGAPPAQVGVQGEVQSAHAATLVSKLEQEAGFERMFKILEVLHPYETGNFDRICKPYSNHEIPPHVLTARKRASRLVDEFLVSRLGLRPLPDLESDEGIPDAYTPGAYQVYERELYTSRGEPITPFPSVKANRNVEAFRWDEASSDVRAFLSSLSIDHTNLAVLTIPRTEEAYFTHQLVRSSSDHCSELVFVEDVVGGKLFVNLLRPGQQDFEVRIPFKHFRMFTVANGSESHSTPLILAVSLFQVLGKRLSYWTVDDQAQGGGWHSAGEGKTWSSFFRAIDPNPMNAIDPSTLYAVWMKTAVRPLTELVRAVSAADPTASRQLTDLLGTPARWLFRDYEGDPVNEESQIVSALLALRQQWRAEAVRISGF